ncbi:CUL2-like protein [Mya arenaria]|uniref:CUL2-like protein n=1 Tax=Mya arenaria TaxID=6604 RepID=A0ABY7D9L6_MYAAR|nr:CUL2-like protein [Mya arenaria]
MSLRPRRVDFDTTWATLLETVNGVITCGSVARATWNDRFSDVYALCVACPDPLGDRLYQETKTFLENHVKTLHQSVLDCNEENLLTVYQRHWDQYSQGASFLNQLYGYLNSTFIKKQKYSDADINYGGFAVELTDQMLEIGELALDTWKKFMIEPIKEQILVLILNEILSDRNGGSVNQTVLHGVITSFVEVEQYKKKGPLQLYEEIFEQQFLSETGQFYRSEAAKLKDECTCSEYMEKVIKKLQDEDFRSRKFLHPSSYGKVTHECQQRMVADHLFFLHGECHDMVQAEMLQDLENMYMLLKPIHGGLQHLVQEVESHIRATGLDAVKRLKGDNVPNQFVESMLQVHSKFTELLKKVFRSDQQFVGALDKLAKYCDNLLKKSHKGTSETELDEKLASCITVFKYLDDKDVYQRQACGYEFTNKLHRMFTDISVSSGLQDEFNTALKETTTDLGLNFSMLVLQAGAWPLGQSNLPTFAIPQELEKSVSEFEKFYNKKYNAELKLNYLKKPYIVTMGSFQMALLLMFNTSDVISFTTMADHTKLGEKEMNKQLQSLLDAKLITTPTEGEMCSQSQFELNMNYANKRTKFKITAAVQKESQQEMEQTRSAVDEDRKMYIQAAIVRIMKARKVLKHTLLIQEVISQAKSRFAPNVAMIKKCIEALIDKQYLERTQNATDEYSYIA